MNESSCIVCGSIPIRCKGLCAKCYFKQHNKRYYQTHKIKIKKRTYRNKRQNNWYYNEHTNEYKKEWDAILENAEKNKMRAKTRYYHIKTGRCRDCGFEGYTEFHHIGKYNPYNVMEVCRECHKNYHH